MAMFNSARGTNKPTAGGGGYNRLSAGNKRYGQGEIAPNKGPVKNMKGYQDRDTKYSAYREALKRVNGGKI